MKLGMNDLGVEVVKKLNLLDDLIKNFTIENGNIVMYNGKNFYNGSVPATEVNTVIKEVRPIVITSNEISELKNHLNKSSDNYISAYDTVLNTTTPFNVKCKNILSETTPDLICRESNRISKVEESNGYIYLTLSDGNFVMFDALKPENQTKTDILGLIRTNFACPKLDAIDINNIYLYTGGFLVPTKYNGIFHLDISNGIYEMFPINNVKNIDFLADGNIACAINDYKNNIVFFNLDTKLKIETSNRINSNTPGQVPFMTKVGANGNYYVLSKSVGMNPSENLLHVWAFDKDTKEYKYISVGANSADFNYQPKILDTYKEKVLICGSKYKKLFIWEYDVNELDKSPIEYIYDIDCDYSEIGYAKYSTDGKILVSVNDCIYILDGSNVDSHFRINNFTKENKITYSRNMNKIIATDNREVLSYNIPEYKTYQNYEASILENKTSNNLSVLIKSNTDNVRAIFYDGNTLQQIIPTYYIIRDGDSIIKIEGCKSTNIKMRLTIPSDSIVEGIVINDNHRFVKERNVGDK